MLSAWREFLELIVEILESEIGFIKDDLLHEIKSYRITQIGEQYMSMSQPPLIGVAQGATATFTLTPLDSSGNPGPQPAGIVPVWVSSDTTNAPVTPTVDGMSATVTASANAPVGTTFTLTATATLADGSTPTSGPVPCPFLGVVPPPFVVASYIITQAS